MDYRRLKLITASDYDVWVPPILSALLAEDLPAGLTSADAVSTAFSVAEYAIKERDKRIEQQLS